MANLLLKAKITEANMASVDINGFKYQLCKIEVGGMTDFAALISVFYEVQVGDCFVTTKWEVTRLDQNDDPVNLCVRVDDLEKVDSDDFEVSPHLNAMVSGELIKSSRCYLRTVGPRKKPFFMCTISLKDETGASFKMLLVAFDNMAKRVSTLKHLSCIRCEVTIRPKQSIPGYEMAVCKLNVIKED